MAAPSTSGMTFGMWLWRNATRKSWRYFLRLPLPSSFRTASFSFLFICSARLQIGHLFSHRGRACGFPFFILKYCCCWLGANFRGDEMPHDYFSLCLRFVFSFSQSDVISQK